MALTWNADLPAEIHKLVGKGLTAAAIHLVRRLKEVLSVAAPRVRVVSKTGTPYYRATTPAVPGAPPRKLSGRLRGSITYELSPDGMVAKVGTNVVYARRHELGTHPFLRVTLDKFKREVEAIMGSEIKTSNIRTVPMRGRVP